MFEGKWMQLENIMLSEVSQTMWNTDPKDKHTQKPNMIMHKLIHKKCL
jgi:hypothetical protein